MNIVIEKKEKDIEIYENDKIIKYEKNRCYIFGNIYNLDTFKEYNNKLSNEENIIKIFEEYKTDAFKLFSGEFAIILIYNNDIYLVRDKIGSHNLYYAVINNTFVASNSYKCFYTKYKEYLEIDKKSLAGYFAYNYIQAPKTVFKDVYKVFQGTYILYNDKINIKTYYDFIKSYKIEKNKIKDEDEAVKTMEESLLNAIKSRTRGYKKIGICFSAGVDSTLIAALAKQIPEKEVHTFTIGFYDEKRNEADRAKKIAEHLNTIHHEFYIDENKAKDIIYKLKDVYSEPISDPSIIPSFYLYENLKDKVDVVLSGDGADQLFSCYYERLETSLYNELKKIKLRFLRIYSNPYCIRYRCAKELLKVKPDIYFNIKGVSLNKHIRYMLDDVRAYLGNCLLRKATCASDYFNNNLRNPFIDDNVVKNCLKLEYKLKYQKPENKYVLRRILYKYIPEELINSQKNGFGVPLKNWLNDYYIEDIIKFTNEDAIKKQNLFDINYINSLIQKLKADKIRRKELNILLSYLLFQMWYQENIEDLWIV